MRIYLPSPVEYFDWLEREDYAYVIMRGFLPFEEGFPGAGSKHDIDMLVEDDAMPAIVERYKRYDKKQGTPCDVYDVSTPTEGVYLKRTYYPAPLAQAMLNSRHRWKGLFYTPGALYYMLGLIYHRLYRKRYPGSGIVYAPDTPFLKGMYVDELSLMAQGVEEAVACTASGFENFLIRHRHDISYLDLAGTLQDFSCKRYVSYFLAQKCAGLQGEVTLSLLRDAGEIGNPEAEDKIVALKKINLKDKVKALVHCFPLATGRLAGRFWLARYAAVIFNPKPIKNENDDPFAFYRHADMPASSKNEAEALSFLPLCFSVAEQEAILADIEKRRRIAA